MWQASDASVSGRKSDPSDSQVNMHDQEQHSRSSSPKPPPREDGLWAKPADRKKAVSEIQSISTATTPLPVSPYSPGPMSPDAQDRVFPIRSVVTVDPNPTPSTRSVRSDTEGFFPPPAPSENSTSTQPPPALSRQWTDLDGGHRPNHHGYPEHITPSYRRVSYSVHDSSHAMNQMNAALADGGSVRSDDTSNRENSIAQSTTSQKLQKEDDIQGLFTARFKHIVTEDGHAVITGRDGDTLQRCEDEPIHIPGAVQSFGLLIVLQDDPDGRLLVRVVSENSAELIGYKPKQLFELESFTDILSDEQTDNLLDHIDFIKDEDADPASNGPEVFTISIRHPHTKKQIRMWCGIHISERHPSLVICEFELEDDVKNPLVPPDEESPEPPVDSLHSNPTAEELAESTINISRPLRVLRSARKRRGETAAMEVFNIMAQVQEQLASAPNLDVFLKVLVGVVKELTGFHRVMVYQFDQQWNGRVVAELVDPRATKDLYKGLNFPASDIPKQARDLYRVNKVRLLYDREQETSRLVCRTVEDLQTPLDMTHAYLRAMSPIHVKYLRNMAVRASMSISINAFDELWGLISCHSYGTRGMRVSFPIRKMCRLIGETASRNIERLSYASRLQARKLINTVPTEKNPGGYIIASSDDLLKLFDADCGLVSIGDETKILGHLDSTQEALALLEYLRMRRLTSVTTSQDIKMEFPDLRYPPGFQVIAGLLIVPLSGGGNDFIVFFRKGQLREVKWAGNPYSKFIREGTEGYLEPRKSFKTWTETVVGKCREWSEEQIETAAVLCLIYGKFIEVWRQKEAALQNSQLTRLLLANSAHEVRTPLNAIINYLEIAMEGTLDSETRENLSRSHSASKSLIYVINDLLDLTKTEEGNELVIRDTAFDLHNTIQEATSSFKADASRKQIDYFVNESPPVPMDVVGDQRRVRQAIFNVVANAIKYTTTGSVKVDTYLTQATPDHIEIEIVVADTGVGMASDKLDALFTELEQVETEGEEPEKSKELEKPGNQKERRVLGLGLAVVSRIIRNMNGQLRVKSEEGKGSRFVLGMGFDLPTRKDGENRESSKAAQSPGPTDGEVTLVSKSSHMSSIHDKPTAGNMRRNSAESMNSAKSMMSGSSARSDVDRLIDAIQEPHMVSRTPSIKSMEARSTVLAPSRPSLSRSQTDIISGAARSSQELGLPTAQPGQLNVTDQGRPLRPVRVPEDAEVETLTSNPLATKAKSKVSFDVPKKPQITAGDNTSSTSKQEKRSKVLVAEDDPTNSKIISKRLERLGYHVTLTVNGEACASVHAENAEEFDAVLMDIQMPIVDGITSTKMIRSREKANPGKYLSPKAAINGRIPIFAVSASLVEREKDSYIATGFDGWILKPIDFKRLDTLLHGIWDQDTRRTCLYQKGEWERGGWFESCQSGVDSADTKPDQENTVYTQSDVPKSQPPASVTGGAKVDAEQERLANLTTDAVSDPSRPTDIGESGNIEASTKNPGNAP